MTGADVSFVHLGITIPHMVKSFSIGGISFAYYGLIIGIGMIMGLLVAQSDAKRRGQDPDIYVDFALYGMPCSVVILLFYAASSERFRKLRKQFFLFPACAKNPRP